MDLRGRKSYLNVPVLDVEAGVEFYCTAFGMERVDAPPDTPVADSVYLAPPNWPDARRLRVYAERPQSVPASADQETTPLMEFRVDDVDGWLKRAVETGATVRVRLVRGEGKALRRPSSDAEASDYAHFLDPFGHLWALAKAEP